MSQNDNHLEKLALLSYIMCFEKRQPALRKLGSMQNLEIPTFF